MNFMKHRFAFIWKSYISSTGFRRCGNICFHMNSARLRFARSPVKFIPNRRVLAARGWELIDLKHFDRQNISLSPPGGSGKLARGPSKWVRGLQPLDVNTER